MQTELIPAEYTLVNKYLLNHYILFKFQRWQFGDFTNEENLFSRILNSYLPRVSALNTLNTCGETEGQRSQCLKQSYTTNKEQSQNYLLAPGTVVYLPYQFLLLLYCELNLVGYSVPQCLNY